jgi:hypothetical protein
MSSNVQIDTLPRRFFVSETCKRYMTPNWLSTVDVLTPVFVFCPKLALPKLFCVKGHYHYAESISAAKDLLFFCECSTISISNIEGRKHR